jgi:hypothetical protein
MKTQSSEMLWRLFGLNYSPTRLIATISVYRSLSFHRLYTRFRLPCKIRHSESSNILLNLTQSNLRFYPLKSCDDWERGLQSHKEIHAIHSSKTLSLDQHAQTLDGIERERSEMAYVINSKSCLESCDNTNIFGYTNFAGRCKRRIR